MARPSPRVHDREATLAGVRLHWVEAGRGPRLLLLHGLGDTAETWRRVLSGLARHHRVIAPDLPGCGTSGPAHGRPLLPWLLRVLHELMERVEPRGGYSVLGNSVGGALALRLALREPARVDRVVLVDPAGAGDDVPLWWRTVVFQRAVRAAFGPALDLLPAAVLETVVAAAFARMVFHRPDRLDSATARRYARHLSRRSDIDGFLERAQEVVGGLRRGPGRPLERLAAPTLVVWGRDDRLAPPRDALPLVRRIPSARLVVIDRCGHMPQLERPAALLAVVEPFLCDGRPGSPRRRAVAVPSAPRRRRAALEERP